MTSFPKRWASSLILTLIGISAIPVAQAHYDYEGGQVFWDLSNQNQYYDAIVSLHDREILNGYEDGRVGVYEEINRAEALTLIARFFEWETPDNLEELDQPFDDVEEDTWYHDTVVIAYEKGVIKSQEDGQFKGAEQVNLAEVLKMLLKGSGLWDEPYVHPTVEDDPAPDVSRTAWFADYVDYAMDLGMVYLEKDGNLNAHKGVTRGEMADILYRFENPGIYSGQMEYGVASYYGLSWTGSNTASGKILDNDEYVTAHKTLPFGTILRVTNVNNGETVDVEVIDRGPYVEGRIVDLSYGAFDAISTPSLGLVEVEVEVVYK